MADRERLLSGRQLVAQLDELEVGTWTAAAVRRWIHEEIPCPIAQRGQNGQSHRYRLVDVVQWLCDRAERAGDRLEAGDTVLQMLRRAAEPSPVPDPGGISAREQACAGLPIQQGATDSMGRPSLKDRVQAAKADGHEDPELLDLLMEVIGGRDPRHWKAAEEAIALRTKRKREEGSLVSDDELQLCLDTQQALFLGAMQGLRAQLKAELAGLGTDLERGRAIDREFDRALERMADAVDAEAHEEASA
ncbi:hypothetical protein [Abyssibacter profundi]|uniref:Uncharacterized protein n=1 Tax=Abyssibacter profundi TaxID=2182787 RepID=A0A363ULA6_9GAMM|nr:hypothetical protein [Abyssibacter profundi]PWN56194.1 hypothetical protein DEH80_07935 [Abyssibacter profundi]